MRKRSRDCNYLRKPPGDVVQAAGEDPYLLAAPMYLQAYAVQLVIDDRRKARLIQCGVRIRSAGRQHRLNAHADLKADRLECFETAGEQQGGRTGGRGHQHGRPAYGGDGNVEGSSQAFLYSRLHRALPQLTEYQTTQ
jgi:hypothetical protein